MRDEIQTQRGGARRWLWQTTGLAGLFAVAIVPVTLAETGLVLGSAPGSNVEQPQGSFAGEGFSISLDNTPVAGATPPYNPERAQDIRLDRGNVSVRYESLIAPRQLNVSTQDLRSGYRGGEVVTFDAYSNYPAYIASAEVLILDRAERGMPVVSRIGIGPNGNANWTMPTSGSGDYAYVLRVTDANGRYDQTIPLALTRTNTGEAGAPFAAPAEGEDRTARRGIPATGGLVTISGEGAAPNGTVMVMGEPIVAGPDGRFVVSRVLPAGDQIVTVNVAGRDFVRDVEIPRSDWFYVGIVDVAANIRTGGIDDEDETSTDGRIAFYLRGQTESGWRVTSSLDTQYGPLEDIFTRLSDKDPRRVLDRLREDAGDLYPTYGDDSTFYDDTPTSGSIYLRVENDTTRILWGDFSAGITGGGLIQNGRDLYGLELRYQSVGVTDQGEPRVSATAYAAQPETLPQRDVLRGTGGSVYFLTRQDVLIGTSKLTVQTVDRDSGFVVESRDLVEGQDYEIDHIQGVVILKAPLGSTASDGGLISDGGGGDYNVNLIAQYEYTPTTGDVDSTVFGGRAEVWVTDELRFGAIVMQDQADAGDQDMVGADIRWQSGGGSYAELQFARSEGPGLNRSTSTDGGLTIVSSGGAAADQAQALRFESRLDLAEFGLGASGSVGLAYEMKEAGFSTLSEDITEDQTYLAVDGEIEATDRLTLSFGIERFEKDGGEERNEVELGVAFDVSPQWTLEAALAMLDQTTPGDASQTGERTDAAIKLTYAVSEDLSVYGFAQATLDVSGGLSDNNRAGLGIEAQINEATRLTAEASDGDGGLGAALRLTYAPTADNEVYLGYSLDPTRHGAGSELSDNGTVVLGARYRVSDTVTTFGETVLDRPGDEISLTEAYGVTWQPNSEWTLSGSMESGTITDSASGDFERTALSFGFAYSTSEDLSVRGRIEYRTEDGDGEDRDRETWALSAGYANQVSTDWRLLASVDALVSESAQSDFRDGEYVRANIGYAYRPVSNERLNVLLGYSYLLDLPGEDQVGADGTTDQPLQISHVLSVAATYDLNEQFTLSGKLGHRSSEVADRGTEDFTDNAATLAVVRLDWHALHLWDVMGEARGLFSPETSTTETGAVIGVYRQVNENVRLGVAYEWGSVSDDETDIDYSGQGLMLNLVGQF